MKKYIVLSFAILLTTISFASAQTSGVNIDVIKTFRQLIKIEYLPLDVPTVLEVEVPSQIYGSHFAVYNGSNQNFEPFALMRDQVFVERNVVTTPTNIRAEGFSGQKESVFDNNFETNLQFDVNADGVGYTEIQYDFSESVRSSSIVLSLDQYVSFPNYVTIKTVENGQEKIVASKIRPTQNVINFPETTSSSWKFEFSFSQPLRINELQINNLNSNKSPSVIRFLAQPGVIYSIYANPELVVVPKTGERPNLISNTDVKKVAVQSVQDNELYQLADTDDDGVPDVFDNCVLTPNTGQEDVNENNRGDVCDDFDKDGVVNDEDNCINEPNQNQIDTDGDLIGDVCDGEESRITEKYPWIVWLGIGFAGLLFVALFVVAIMKIRRQGVDIRGGSEEQTS